jgi:hypothetical protein
MDEIVDFSHSIPKMAIFVHADEVDPRLTRAPGSTPEPGDA